MGAASVSRWSSKAFASGSGRASYATPSRAGAWNASDARRSRTDARPSLRPESIDDRVFAVDGTPTDCVTSASPSLSRAMRNLVVSGINKGWNLGDDVTVLGHGGGRARAALLGISQPSRCRCASRGASTDFVHAAHPAAVMADASLQAPLPGRQFPQHPTCPRDSRRAMRDVQA